MHGKNHTFVLNSLFFKFVFIFCILSGFSDDANSFANPFAPANPTDQLKKPYFAKSMHDIPGTFGADPWLSVENKPNRGLSDTMDLIQPDNIIRTKPLEINGDGKRNSISHISLPPAPKRNDKPPTSPILQLQPSAETPKNSDSILNFDDFSLPVNKQPPESNLMEMNPCPLGQLMQSSERNIMNQQPPVSSSPGEKSVCCEYCF